MKDIKPLNLDDILNENANGASELFARALHTYVNYEDLAAEAAKKGAVMKESRDHYEYLVLRELENLFKGKDKVEIALKVMALFY